MKRFILIISMSLFLTSCSFSRSIKNDPLFSPLLNTQHQLLRPMFLVKSHQSHYYLTEDRGFYGKSFLPEQIPTFEEYKSKQWYKNRGNNVGFQYILGIVPQGTKVIIVDVIKELNFELGPQIKVVAVIMDSEYGDRRILIGYWRISGECPVEKTGFKKINHSLVEK